MKDTFLTIATSAESYLMERGSKFYVYAFPVETEQEVAIHLQQLKKEHPKARHFCTAMRLHPDAALERSSDDGEPSGSAGRPILGQLIRLHITNCVIVVVRYFGGTKLGIPGLIDAYKTSAALCLDAARVIEKHVFAQITISLHYQEYPSLLNYLRQRDILILEEVFLEKIEVTIGLKFSAWKEILLETLRDFSRLDYDGLDQYEEALGFEIDVSGEALIR